MGPSTGILKIYFLKNRRLGQQICNEVIHDAASSILVINMTPLQKGTKLVSWILGKHKEPVSDKVIISV